MPKIFLCTTVTTSSNYPGLGPGDGKALAAAREAAAQGWNPVVSCVVRESTAYKDSRRSLPSDSTT